MPPTLLLVDDTPANLSVLVDSLSGAGYRLLVAEDGDDALTQSASTVPDLILLDVMMPGMDGFETCKHLKSNPATKDIPVIFMTALSDTSDKVRAFEAGAVDYVTKPFQQEEVISRVRAHLELRFLRRQVEEQLSLRERFMRIAGHDLRNHLCLVLLTTEVAQRTYAKTGQNPKIESQLGIISSAGDQMRNIIDTFLDLSPPQVGGESNARADLNRVVEAVITQHTHAAQDKCISVHRDFTQPLPKVQATSATLFQAMTNYIGNAIKFTPIGGKVTVRTVATTDGVRAEVMDSGPGVPSHERAQLFKEFAQLSVRPTAGESSHGIGLSIVKQVIESTGGRVGTDFPDSGGSVFWFELKIALEELS